jgi:hypothetical protein
MKSSPCFFVLTATFLSLITVSPTLINHATARRWSQVGASAEQAAFEQREAAYRANNLGVAMLEQYKAKDAVEYFTRALELKSDRYIISAFDRVGDDSSLIRRLRRLHRSENQEMLRSTRPSWLRDLFLLSAESA